jgi:hypothetical protein
MIIRSIDGDSLVLTKTKLSEQGQNYSNLSRTRSYVKLVDLGPAINAESPIGLYAIPGNWRDPHRRWVSVGARLYPKMGSVGCKTFGEAATKKIRKAVRAALKVQKAKRAVLKAKKGSKKKKK